MAGTLHRLTAKLYDTPHIVTQAALDDIFEVVNDRNNGVEIVNEEAIIKGEYEATDLQIEDGVAVLDLRGTTVFRETAIDALCGLVSYQGLDRNIDTIIERKDEIKLITAFIDSPGGEAFRAFEMGNQIKAKLKESGIKSVAYVDGMAASGGYVIASAFDEIISNPDSEVGSIGVRIAIRNPSEEDKGKIRYITAGENKVPFTPDGDYTEGFIEKLQEGVNSTYDNFITYVADTRGMTREAVINTKADTFSAKKALSLGLVDKVMTGMEFVEYVATLKEQASEGVSLQPASTTNSRIEDDSVEDSTVELLDENLNVEGLSLDDIELNGDEMSDKELSQLEIEVAEMKEQMAAMVASNSAKDAQLAELAAEKEAAAKVQAEELAKAQEAIDAQDKEAFADFTKGVSYAGEDKAELASILFDVDRKLGNEVSTKLSGILAAGQTAIDAMPEQISDAAPIEEEAVEDKSKVEVYQDRVAKRLKEIQNK